MSEDGDLIGGRFMRAQGRRAGVVSTGARSIRVRLAPAAFVAHGTEGRVTSLAAFVPGERVLIRGAASQRWFLAFEFQSVYTRETGTVVASDGGEAVLVTSSGLRVRIPEKVAQRYVPSGLERGSTYSASVWTNPSTGESTAVGLRIEA
jgi:hypothetical protein